MFIKCQLTKHCYLRRLPTGSEHNVALATVSSRTLAVLQQISLQFSAKTSAAKFVETKTIMKQTINEIEKLKDVADTDWVFLST